MSGRAERRARGVFYTPTWIVEHVVDQVIARALARASWRDGIPALRILDPSAGDGRFLIACVDRLVAAAVERARANVAPSPSIPPRAGVALDSVDVRRAIVRRCIVGVERDPVVARETAARLGPGADVRVAEALLGGAIEPGAYDVVAGNPPYVRSVTLRASDPSLWRALRGRFAATSHREWDLYAAFIDASLTWAAPGGEIGWVVPSRWLTAAFAAPLRERLARERAVRKLIDFGPAQVFPDATTYASLVFLTSPAPSGAGTPGSTGASDRRRIEVARWIGDPDVVPPLPPTGEGWTVGHADADALSSAPWTLAVGRPAREIASLRRAGAPLGSLARIAKGAGTNADPVFLLGLDGSSSALGERVRVEPELLVPCLRGRDVGWLAGEPRRVALLPYHDRGAPLDPDELSRRFPAGAAYLERCRPLLDRRERGRFVGASFYRWGRPQNLAWLRDRAPKIVVPDAARGPRAALDPAGTLVIDTAYAIRSLDERRAPLGLILAVLASPIVVTWLRATGVPLRGGYFRMKTAYLASLPIPPMSRAAREVADLALALAQAGSTTDAARDALGEAVVSLYA